jgi:hypothetical protein
MTFVNGKKLAVALGVNDTSISKWKKMGYITRSAQGYDLEAAQHWFDTVGKFRQNVGGTIAVNGAYGTLVDFLREQCEEQELLGESGAMIDLTVMSAEVDPFRLGQPHHHEAGKWLRAQYDRLAKGQRIHLRGLHYRMVAAGDVIKPDGSRYINTEEDWLWLLDKASKWSRWLGYIPFQWIVDEYNDTPEIYIPEAREPFNEVRDEGEVIIPDDVDEAMPQPACGNLAQRQPYRIIFIGEKSSLAAVVRPIAIRVGAEMMLFAGNSSLTGMAEIAERIVADGRPAIVLYLSDFDPTGWNMPTAFSRQLQGYLCMANHGSAVQVRRVALTKNQCVVNDLPSTPLKDADKPSSKRWIAVWGREQTEIDALAALKPDVLQRIVEDAVAPFWDPGLTERAREAEEEWREEAQDALIGHPDYDDLVEIVEEALEELRRASEKYDEARALAVETLKDVELPEAEPVEPEDSVGLPFDELDPDAEIDCDELDDDVVFDTRADFVPATRRLKDQKI